MSKQLLKILEWADVRESPDGRRSLCYDRPALDSRKENKPAGSAVELAADLCVSSTTTARPRTTRPEAFEAR